MEGVFLLPHPWAAPKKPILNRIKTTCLLDWCFQGQVGSTEAQENPEMLESNKKYM